MSNRIVLHSVIIAGAIVLFSFYSLSGCFNHSPASALPTTKMKIGEKEFDLEIAATEGARNTGLMRRDSMARATTG